MRQLKTAVGTFGPFALIEVMDDRYVCDGFAYQFDVVGEGSIEDWVAPAVVPAPPEVPREISRRQALQALLLRGMLTKVPLCIDAIPDPIEREMARIEFEASQVFERDRPLVHVIGAMLDLDDTGLDELFIFAKGL